MKPTVYAPKVKLDVKKFGKDRFLKVLGQQAKDFWYLMKENILAGKGADGKEIKPGGYSEGYKKAMRAGRVTNHDVTKPYTDTPNLTISGHMIGAVQQKRTADGAELFFADQNMAVIASALMDQGYQHWFELGEQDVKRIDAAVEKELDLALAELLPEFK